MATKPQIAKIHALKNELKLSNEEYRAALGRFDVWSSKELDVYGANAFIDALIHEKMRREGFDRPGIEPEEGIATKPQLAYIHRLFMESGGTIEYPGSWMTKVIKRYVRGAYDLTKDEAKRVIDALKRHNGKRKK